MICGSAEAESRRYHTTLDPRGLRWLWSNDHNPGDHIYVEGGPNSNGFGGRTLTFELVDGSSVALKGPWHSNSGALFANTGVDLRDKHLTCGIVALKRTCGRLSRHEPDEYDEVLHYDIEPVVGAFDRIEAIAKKEASMRHRPVFYAFVSASGGCSGQVQP